MRNKKIIIIAEVGVNHNGKINKAIKLIKEAKKVGADIIKFQTFKARDTVTITSKKANYQINNTNRQESQYSMLKKLELSYQDFKKLFSLSKKLKIEFLSTAFDLESLIFLK